jgi:hypothetical protein
VPLYPNRPAPKVVAHPLAVTMQSETGNPLSETVPAHGSQPPSAPIPPGKTPGDTNG